MKKNISADFQICISVPLNVFTEANIGHIPFKANVPAETIYLICMTN